MFGLTKKEKLQAVVQENAVAFRQVVENARKQMEKSDKIADAGERYLALVRLEEGIRNEIGAASSRIDQQAYDLLEKPRRSACKKVGFGAALVGGAALGVTLVAAPAALATAVAVGGFLLFGGAGLGFVGGDEAGAGKNLKLFQDGLDDFSASLDEVSRTIVRKKDSLLRHDLPGLAASPHFEELYDRIPAVKDAFTRAAARASVIAPPVIGLDKPRPPGGNSKMP